MGRIAWAPVLLALTALGVGAGLMTLFIITKDPLAQASVEKEEKSIAVVTQVVAPESVDVELTGFGHVKALKEIDIVPEVSGKIISMHPNINVGGVIPEGETIFQIDPRPYEARVAEARAQVLQREQSITRLGIEETELKRQLGSVKRAYSLAMAQLKRAQQLRDGGVGTETAVDQAEQSVVTARAEMDRAEHQLALIPLQVEEAQSMKASAEASLELVTLDLANTSLKAPFTARVKERLMEKDQVVAAGSRMLSLVDDTILEVRIPLDSRDASQWLQFETIAEGAAKTSWFSSLKSVPCTLRWTEAANGERWNGVLDRVESFNPESHTLSVVIRVAGEEAHAHQGRIPLVEGMFCEATIPGRPLENVYRVPLNAVTIDNKIYLAVDNRLKTFPVELARSQGEYALIQSGLNPGDEIITTRLVNPLDNTLLEIAATDEGSAE